MKSKIYYLKGIRQEEGEDVINWIEKSWNLFKDKGNYFELYISESRFDELIRDLHYHNVYFDLTIFKSFDFKSY